MERRCLLDPVEEIFKAARLLSLAADAHLFGDLQRADGLIRRADDDAVRQWTEALWGQQAAGIHRYREVPGSPPAVTAAARTGSETPTADVRRAVIARDGYHCRFCGVPVVGAKVRQAIRAVYPEALPWGSTNPSQHAAFQCMNLQFDHVIPYSRGGPTSLENLVVTCAPCNFGRGSWTVEEVGLIDPRTVPVGDGAWDGYAGWDGLSRFLHA